MDPARHADSRNIVESILRYIPGFKGYLEKEYRRESDELARSHLANELQRSKESLDRYQRVLADTVQLDALPACERVRTRLDTIQSRIKGAMQGYSGFFDFVRVDESMLDKVYALDVALATDVAALRESIEALPSATAPHDQRIAAVLEQVEQLHRQFDQRSELLQGLSSKS